MQTLSHDAMFTTCRSRRTKTSHLQEIRTTTSTDNRIIFIGHSTEEHSSFQACKSFRVILFYAYNLRQFYLVEMDHELRDR